MRFALLAVALATSVMPSIASAAAEAQAGATMAHRGSMIRDVNNVRLGTVTRVGEDGSAAIIFNSRLVYVPATTLSTVDGKLVTSLTKKQVSALR